MIKACNKRGGRSEREAEEIGENVKEGEAECGGH